MIDPVVHALHRADDALVDAVEKDSIDDLRIAVGAVIHAVQLMDQRLEMLRAYVVSDDS